MKDFTNLDKTGRTCVAIHDFGAQLCLAARNVTYPKDEGRNSEKTAYNSGMAKSEEQN